MNLTEYQIIAAPAADSFGLLAIAAESCSAGIAKACGGFAIGTAYGETPQEALQDFLDDAKSAGNTLADFVERLGPKAT